MDSAHQGRDREISSFIISICTWQNIIQIIIYNIYIFRKYKIERKITITHKS